ncbi:arylsulfatase [Gloeocapsopsis dulcis]|uniref:N-acetylgalactosamine-6-sulfatase n=1 Tax=Gloeocapsopsis dulcis AAB1 = 1H9 TaxID=1433147 RepID=A0A6N8FSZ8_9CHRO|nr:arylsulfatase [Gloeocapsopsis dulcis]MUL35692.1 N-acetylgalactosamine-6-sulfatase [Gloeocapsopsis dulcis AAB1 = 1H9]WNN91026.1 arylsulfatase [Gloeocapsopsis dulcis]
MSKLSVHNLVTSQYTKTSRGVDSATQAQRRPNIILILADDLGYGDLGCYGQKYIKTPHLDQMAREGMRFTDFYSGSTVCAPSRCTLMTGYHTGHCRIRGNNGADDISLLAEDITIAEILKAAGYTTAMFGKWGLGGSGSTGEPHLKGFDEWFGYLNHVHAHDYYPSYLWRQQRIPISPGTYSHNLFTQEALDFIRRKQDEPFFLYLPYTIPHANNELGDEGMQVPSDAPYSHKPWPQQQKNYAAMISFLDADVGRILALLAELNLEEDTIVFFSSDNGPHEEGGATAEFFDSNGPLNGIKRDLYDGGVRVPMIARWLGTIQPGEYHQPYALWDFLPTATEIAGIPTPKGIDGISMLPVLLSQPANNHEFLYWEFHERGFEQAIRMNRWKAVRHGIDRPIELYDLEKDVSEQRNVANKYPEVVQRIADILQSKSLRVESPEFPVFSNLYPTHLSLAKGYMPGKLSA